MESNNTILNNENFLNTFQHFPNNLAMEFNSMLSLNNTHTNNTDFNINNNNYSIPNNMDNFSIHTNNNQRSDINSIHQNEQINYSTLTLSHNIDYSLENNNNREEEEESEEENEENEENINSTEIINENNSLPEFTYGNILQNNNENENITLLNTLSNRNNNNLNTYSNFNQTNNNLNHQQENNTNALINKNEEMKLTFNKEDNKNNDTIVLKLDQISSSPINKNYNNYQKFLNSPQYSDLQKTFLYANKIFRLKGENTFEIGTDEGNEICQEFLNQIEVLMKSMNIKGQDRTYRKKFTKAYYLLFEENKLSFLSEILDSEIGRASCRERVLRLV